MVLEGSKDRLDEPIGEELDSECLARDDLFPCLLDLLVYIVVAGTTFDKNLLGFKVHIVRLDAFRLGESTVHSSRTTRASHLDLEFVLVFRHVQQRWVKEVERGYVDQSARARNGGCVRWCKTRQALLYNATASMYGQPSCHHLFPLDGAVAIAISSPSASVETGTHPWPLPAPQPNLPLKFPKHAIIDPRNPVADRL